MKSEHILMYYLLRHTTAEKRDAEIFKNTLEKETKINISQQVQRK